MQEGIPMQKSQRTELLRDNSDHSDLGLSDNNQPKSSML